MRILFLTNFYLVHGSGGEEQSCQQVVEGLQQRGHATLVLTSMHDSNNVPVEADGVYRSLYLEMDLVPLLHSITFFTKRKAREKYNLQVFERVVQEFDPDIIFIWGMWNLHRSLAIIAEARYPNKIVYRFASYWPTLPSQHELYWRSPGRHWYSRLPKQALGHLALTMLEKEVQQYPFVFKHAICVSAASRDILVRAGIPISHARIIYTGLDVDKFLNAEQHQRSNVNRILNLLYAGRLTSEKGIDTVVDAMTSLVHGQSNLDIKLSLAGSGSADYENHLRRRIKQAGLTDDVLFLGWVPPEEMPELLNKFDVLIVPSLWPEPFARVVLEGMISGLVVVASSTGGTTEIIADGENGLLFTAGDDKALTQKIVSLASDPMLRDRLGLAGKQLVIERFTNAKMMDEIENYLHEVLRPSSDEKVSLLQIN